MPYRAGESALVVPVPELEMLVSSWREEFDPSARMGMPAHITVLYPFLDRTALTQEVIGELRSICLEQPAVDVTFHRTARFPGVLYLEPSPSAPFVALTERIAARWPDYQPFGGAFAEVIPHLTVAVAAPPDLDHVLDREIRAGLPVATRLNDAALFVFDGSRWARQLALPLRQYVSES